MLRTLAFLSLTLVGPFIWSTLAMAMPAQVVIIRHGEKPEEGNELNAQGCERAFLLPAFFKTNPLINQFGRPVAIFAQTPDSDSGSLRPIQTVVPTAVVLNEMIRNTFVRKDWAGLSHEIFANPAFDGRTILIAWEHVVIPKVAEALGLPLTPDLATWPDTVFDEAWVLTFAPTGVALQIIPEKVLPSDNPIGGLAGWTTSPPSQPQGSIPAAVVQKCLNNDSLNSLLPSLITSPLAMAP